MRGRASTVGGGGGAVTGSTARGAAATAGAAGARSCRSANTDAASAAPARSGSARTSVSDRVEVDVVGIAVGVRAHIDLLVRHRRLLQPRAHGGQRRLGAVVVAAGALARGRACRAERAAADVAAAA